MYLSIYIYIYRYRYAHQSGAHNYMFSLAISHFVIVEIFNFETLGVLPFLSTINFICSSTEETYDNKVFPPGKFYYSVCDKKKFGGGSYNIARGKIQIEYFGLLGRRFICILRQPVERNLCPIDVMESHM